MWLLALTLAHAKDRKEAPAEAPAESLDPAESEDEAADRPVGMAGHFQQATLAMLAVAVNDLDEARDLGFQMSKDKMAPAPLRAAAKDVYKAKTISKAAPAVA